MNRDLPSISSGSYGGSTVMNLATFGDNVATATAAVPTLTRGGQIVADAWPPNLREVGRRILDKQYQHEEKTTMAAKRRFVQVFVVDPNELIPLEQSVIYKGEPKLTDATDQELFFELDMKNLLERHNELRVKVVDKKVKDRTEYLEPAKIRDLKMVVVNIAEF